MAMLKHEPSPVQFTWFTSQEFILDCRLRLSEPPATRFNKGTPNLNQPDALRRLGSQPQKRSHWHLSLQAAALLGGSRRGFERWRGPNPYPYLLLSL
jgi:hypothetical protein